MNSSTVVPTDHSLRVFEFLVEQSDEVVFWTDELGRLLGCNAKMRKRFGYGREELLTMSVSDLDETVTPESRRLLLLELEQNGMVKVQTQPRNKLGIKFTMEFDVHRFVVDDNVYLLTYGREVQLEKQLRNRVLAAIATEMPLDQILSLIVELAEKTRIGMIGFIALDEGAGRLRIRDNQSLRQSFVEAIQGTDLIESTGPIGDSINQRKTVVIESIHQSPLRAPWVEEFTVMGVQTCWSEPIFSSDHQVLGAIAMLFCKQTNATAYDRELLKMIAHLASIAIEGSRKNEALRESEIRFRSLVERTSEIIWTTSPEGKFVVEQESWENYTGQSWESHQGFGWSEMIHEHDRERILAYWMNSLDQMKPVDVEGRIFHAKSNTHRYLNIRATPVFLHGKAVEWVGNMIDIHDRKLAEEKFTRSQFILSQSQAVAGLGSWIWDFKSNRVHWTEEFSRLHGLKIEQREGEFDSLIEHCIESDRPKLQKALKQTLVSGHPCMVEYQIRGPENSVRTVVSKTKFELDENGRRCGLIGIVHDITDAKQAEINLLKSEHQLRMITDSMPVMISYVDLDYRFQFNNALYESTFNMSRQEMKGCHIQDVIGKITFEENKPHFDRAFRGLPAAFEEKAIDSKGGIQIRETRLVPDFDSNRNVVGAFVLVLDITDRRDLEREILTVAADQQSRIGQDLHDGTGQELTGIGMVADALLQTLARRDADEVDIAERLCRGIKRSLKQIRSVARGLNPVDVSPGGLVSALTEMTGYVEELYAINCSLICNTDLVIKDNQVATQLFRIAQEATTNACKHSGATNVTIQLLGYGREVVLSISDNGCGIENVEDVLTEQNTGMGLRSLKYRARSIQANLTFSSIESGGTVVQCKVVCEYEI